MRAATNVKVYGSPLKKGACRVAKSNDELRELLGTCYGFAPDQKVPLHHPDLKLKVAAVSSFKAMEAILNHGWVWGVPAEGDYTLIRQGDMPDMQTRRGCKWRRHVREKARLAFERSTAQSN